MTIGTAVVLAEERRPQGGRPQFEGRRQTSEGRPFENRRGGYHRGGDKQVNQQGADGQQAERGNRRGNNAGRGGDRKGNNTNKNQPNAQPSSPSAK